MSKKADINAILRRIEQQKQGNPSSDSRSIGSENYPRSVRDDFIKRPPIVDNSSGSIELIAKISQLKSQTKPEERNLLDAETVKRNSDAVAAQIRKVFGRSDFIEENNVKLLNSLNLIDCPRPVAIITSSPLPVIRAEMS